MEIALLLMAAPVYFILTKMFGVSSEDAGQMSMALALFVGVPAVILIAAFG